MDNITALPETPILRVHQMMEKEIVEGEMESGQTTIATIPFRDQHSKENMQR